MPSIYVASSHHMWAKPNGYMDALSVYSGKTGFHILRDRFGYLNKFSPYNLYEPSIPMFSTNYTDKFSDIMDFRAVELLKKSITDDKDLYIFLSGGVDSTAMTIALLKNSFGKNERLHIVYTKYTIDENPNFILHLKNLGIDMKLVLPGRALNDAQRDAMKKGYAITGWCADQLFGSQINQILTDDMYYKDWRIWVKNDTAIQQFEEAFSYYNFPIKTFGEFAWFMNFACKYDFVKYTDVLLTGEITNCMIPFYDTECFNKWSVSNFDVLHKHPQTDPIYYKEELKKYIYDYNKDDEYKRTKGKLGSWGLKNSNDDMSLWTFPIKVILMESPFIVRVEDSGIERPDDNISGYIRNMIMENILTQYIRY